VGTLRPAQQRAQAGQQLEVVKGLDEVIVGPQIERAHLVHRGVAHGQHQDGDRRRLADAPADLEAVGRGHLHVEHDQVRRLLGEEPQRLRAVGGDRHLAVGPEHAQAKGDHLGHVARVLGNQHSQRHGASLFSP